MATPARPLDPGTTCTTADMVLVHRVIRHVLGGAPALVRGVAPGDVRRARVVGEHVRDTARGLHLHHHTEDALLWDTLEQRSPGCAVHVGLMRSQHAAIARLLEELEPVEATWETTADAVDRDAVADLLDRILATLETHLGQEEGLILPVAARTMSQQEWDRLGAAGRAGVPKSKRFLQLGWMLDALGPQDSAQFVHEFLPAPVRAMWSLVGKRQFAAHRRALYGR